MNKLNVYVEIQGKNTLIGHIDVNNDQGMFSYEEEYLQNPNSSPISISLPLEEQKRFLMDCFPRGLQDVVLLDGCIKKKRITYLF